MSPLVCLHGFTGTPRAFEPLALPARWAPYLTGHGPDPDLSSQTFGAEVARIEKGLREHAAGPVHLLAYSMGARIALGLLDTQPELFSGATLVGVSPGLSSEDARQERLGWEAQWIDILERDGLAVFEQEWQKQALFSTQASLPPRFQDAQRSARLSHTASGLVHALRVLGLASMPDFWPRLRRIETPVTLVHGARDIKFADISVAMTQAQPRFRSVAIQGVGHNPLLEAPEAIRSLMLDAES